MAQNRHFQKTDQSTIKQIWRLHLKKSKTEKYSNICIFFSLPATDRLLDNYMNS